MDHLIIGTAGHVDHGKTVLIKALTGVDTDRLREEKERGISIDLGFAPFRLPGGRLAGVVDVPGHERFIHNMLAGAAGMDLVLLVVDATEGVMPQTREHLDILELLRVQKGIVVVTKIDLVDLEWRELVREEIREELHGTFLEKAPVCAVSAFTGEGLPELKELIDAVTREVVPRDAAGPLRLPVDRSFSIAGFGTVVTGTLLSGTVRSGDTVTVLPPGVEARVRNIQVHDTDVQEAGAGRRVALNLSGLEKEQIQRGSVVSTPGYYRLTSLVDVAVTLLKRAPRPLANLDPVHFYLGTARTTARLLLLDREELKPGEKAPAQCRLERPLVADRGERFIIRSYSPMTTIGGGIVLDPLPARHRRFRLEVLQHLAELEQEPAAGGDRAFVRQKLQELVVADRPQLEKATRLGAARLEKLLAELTAAGQVERLGDSYVGSDTCAIWEERVIKAMDDHLRRHPLAAGLSRASCKAVVEASLSQRAYDAFLQRLGEKGKITVTGDLVAPAGHATQPSPADRKALDLLDKAYDEGRFQPPSPREAAREATVEDGRREEFFTYLVAQGVLVRVDDDLYFHRRHYEEALEMLRRHFAAQKTLTLAQFRDMTGSSRKYMQPLLEHFDRCKLTRRVGDERVPWKLQQE